MEMEVSKAVEMDPGSEVESIVYVNQPIHVATNEILGMVIKVEPPEFDDGSYQKCNGDDEHFTIIKAESLAGHADSQQFVENQEQESYSLESCEQNYACSSCEVLMKKNTKLEKEIHDLKYLLSNSRGMRRSAPCKRGNEEFPGLDDKIYQLKLQSSLKIAKVYNEGLEKELDRLQEINMSLVEKLKTLSWQPGAQHVDNSAKRPDRFNKANLVSAPFSFAMIRKSNSDTEFYTGFRTYPRFLGVFDYLHFSKIEIDIFPKYILELQPQILLEASNQSSVKQSLRNSNLAHLNEFFLVMVWLKLGLFSLDLAHRFFLPEATIFRICQTWTKLLSNKLSALCTWPPVEEVMRTMPLALKNYNPKIRVIFDIVEVTCEGLSPNSFFQVSNECKTLKALIAITPDGNLCFCSNLFSGELANKDVLIQSGLIGADFVTGDCLVPCRELHIPSILMWESDGLMLNVMPLPLSIRSDQSLALTFSAFAMNQINLFKSFRLFDRPIENAFNPILNQIFKSSVYLANIFCKSNITWS